MLSRQKLSVVWNVLCKREMVSGMLTNFKTIQSRIARLLLKAIEKMSEDGTFDVLPKKKLSTSKEDKLEKTWRYQKEIGQNPGCHLLL